jgi:hypothetical protein
VNACNGTERKPLIPGPDPQLFAISKVRSGPDFSGRREDISAMQRVANKGLSAISRHGLYPYQAGASLLSPPRLPATPMQAVDLGPTATPLVFVAGRIILPIRFAETAIAQPSLSLTASGITNSLTAADGTPHTIRRTRRRVVFKACRWPGTAIESCQSTGGSPSLDRGLPAVYA